MKVSIAALPIAFLAAAFAESPTGDALLSRIITHPGSYSQVCDIVTAESDIPYRAFELTDFAGASFSKSNQALIDQNRDALVPAIRARLLAVNFDTPEESPAADPKPEENFDGEPFGCDPKSLNPLLLNLIQQIHAIEALPELLTVEQELVKRIEKSKNDADAPAPVVAGWFVGYNYPDSDKKTDAERERFTKLFQARVAQRDLVMLMALLMREKSYPPYLKTSLEAAYAKGLKKTASVYPTYKIGDPLPEGKYGTEFQLDPIVRVLRRDHDFVSIPYTRESRDQIRAAAAKWVAEHP
jgi:hypothetical protein